MAHQRPLLLLLRPRPPLTLLRQRRVVVLLPMAAVQVQVVMVVTALRPAASRGWWRSGRPEDTRARSR